MKRSTTMHVGPVYTHLSIATTKLLWIQKFDRNQGMHSVRISYHAISKVYFIMEKCMQMTHLYFFSSQLQFYVI